MASGANSLLTSWNKLVANLHKISRNHGICSFDIKPLTEPIEGVRTPPSSMTPLLLCYLMKIGNSNYGHVLFEFHYLRASNPLFFEVLLLSGRPSKIAIYGVWGGFMLTWRDTGLLVKINCYRFKRAILSLTWAVLCHISLQTTRFGSYHDIGKQVAHMQEMACTILHADDSV